LLPAVATLGTPPLPLDLSLDNHVKVDGLTLEQQEFGGHLSNGHIPEKPDIHRAGLAQRAPITTGNGIESDVAGFEDGTLLARHNVRLVVYKKTRYSELYDIVLGGRPHWRRRQSGGRHYRSKEETTTWRVLGEKEVNAFPFPFWRASCAFTWYIVWWRQWALGDLTNTQSHALSPKENTRDISVIIYHFQLKTRANG